MLDQVVFRRVRRQEMTLEYPAESAQGHLSLPARVDDVVVEDEVDPFGLRIDFAQFLEQLDELDSSKFVRAVSCGQAQVRHSGEVRVLDDEFLEFMLPVHSSEKIGER